MNEDTRDPGKLSFLLVFLLLAVGIVIAGWFYNHKIAQDYSADAARQLSAIANLKVDELVQWRKERLADSSVLFHNAALSALVRRFLEKPEDADAQRQLQVWLGKFQGHDRYDEVRLLDAQGVWRLSLPAGLPPVSTSVLGGITNVLQSGQVAFQDFYRSEQDQQVCLGILVPILDEQDTNRPLGVVYLRINPATYLYPFILRWPTPSKTAETLLVRREGDEVLFLNELRFQTNTALTLRFSLDRITLPAAQAVLGREGTIKGLDYRGAPVLAALRSIPDSPWALVARMDNEEVYAPLRAQLWRLAAMLTALLIAAGAGVGLIWRQNSVRHYRKAEAEARASEQELRSLAESMPQIVWITRPDGWTIYFNRQWVDYTGLTLEESYGHGWNTPFHPDDQQRAWDAWQNATQNGTTYSVECRLRRADSAYRWWLIRGVPQRDVEGKILKWFGTCTDIEDIKQAEVAEKRARQRLNEAQRIGRIGDWDFDIATLAITWSQQVFEILGRDPKLGQPRDLEEAAAMYDAASKNLLKENVARAIESGEAQDYELLTLRPDGGRVHVQARAVPRKGKNGKVVGLYGTVQDITERKQAEAALQEKQLLLLESQRIAHIGGWSWAFTGPIQWTDETYRLYGVSPETFSPTLEALVNLVHPEDRPGMREWVCACSAGEKPAELEFRCVWPDGTVRFLSGRGERINDAENRPTRIFGTVQDITERKQAEAEIRIKNQVFEDSIASQSIADKDGGITHVNPAFLRLWGYAAKEDAIGKTAGSFFANPADATPVLEALAAHDAWDGEFLARRTDGTMFISRGYASSLRNAAGELIGYQSTNLDVTRERESEEKFSTAFKISPYAITITRARDGAFIEVNDAFTTMAGFTREEACADSSIGLKLWMKNEDRDQVLNELRAGRTVVGHEYQFRTKGDKTFMGSFSARAILLGGEPCILSNIADITERKLAEAEIVKLNEELEQRVQERTAKLEATNKELDAFSYSVSHDLRAPLRHVQGYVDMLAQEAEGRLSDKGRHYMQTIADASREMGVLIDDLLAFSRMGRAEMFETPSNLDTLVQDTLRDLEETVRGRNIVWKIPPLPAVQADPAMLKLVLANLLGNAVKFTRPRDPAQIEMGSAGTEEGRVIVFVRDNGVGFDPQYAHKLFGIFQRLHRADEFEGTGIGLANVQRIIARHGGRTWAEGKLNEGATFYFTMKPSVAATPINSRE